MVCCQRSGKNDPEQIAASFPQTTRREEGRGKRGGGGGDGAGGGGGGGSGVGPQIFSTLRMTYARPPAPRPPAMTVVGRLALLATHGDQNIVACFMGSLIAVVCLAGRVGRSRSTVHQIVAHCGEGGGIGLAVGEYVDRQFLSSRSRSQYSTALEVDAVAGGLRLHYFLNDGASNCTHLQ